MSIQNTLPLSVETLYSGEYLEHMAVVGGKYVRHTARDTPKTVLVFLKRS